MNSLDIVINLTLQYIILWLFHQLPSNYVTVFES